MKYKKILAKNITEFYHGQKLAQEAEENFETAVQNKTVDEQKIVKVKTVDGITLLEFLKTAVGDKYSAGEIKRVVEQGGTAVAGKVVVDYNRPIHIESDTLIKFGKREFFRPIN